MEGKGSIRGPNGNGKKIHQEKEMQKNPLNKNDLYIKIEIIFFKKTMFQNLKRYNCTKFMIYEEKVTLGDRI